ncbi:hypothetical protein MMC26_001988 [Xylographa opegraphella]|nr:hypothetical protein [Xylographa opegraphella]
MRPASGPGPDLRGSLRRSPKENERTATQAVSTEVRLTFGIELEFFYKYDLSYTSELRKLASRYEIYLEPEMEHNLIFEIVARMLAENNVPVSTFRESHYKAKYDKWIVKTECPTWDPPEANSETAEIEVVSRILVLEEKSFEEVRLVLAILENFPGPYKFYVNRLTGFHVHVGAEQRRFVLPFLKKFTQTVTAFEHEIESLHSDDRIRNQFAGAPSQQPELLSRLGPLTSIAVLDRQKTFEDINEVFSDERHKAYNLRNLIDPDTYPSHETKRKQTIEFRQHAGTLDGDTICNWIEFVCALVKYSFGADHKENLVFLVNHLKNFPETAYSIEDLMKKIGVPHLFPWYKDNDKISDRSRVGVEHLPKIKYDQTDFPDLQPLWDLLQDDASGIKIGVGVRGTKRGREEDTKDEEEQAKDTASKKKRRS